MRTVFVSPFLFAVAQGALLSNTTFSIGGPVTLATTFNVGGAVSLTKPTISAVANTTWSTTGAAKDTTSSSSSTNTSALGTTRPNSGVITSTTSFTKSTSSISLATTSPSSGTTTVTVTFTGPPKGSAGFTQSITTTTTSSIATATPYDDRYWHPKVGSKFQIILDRNANRRGAAVRLVPSNAEIFDLDLFDTPVELIQQIHDEGKRVICYFSAGGSESWRADYQQLKAKDKGQPMKKWPNEQWLNIRSPDVWEVMRARIELAGTKGCDAIDADNTDVFNDDSGLGGGFNPPLSEADTIDFIKKLAAEAHRNGVALGIKNAEDIFAGVINDIDFAVNEECATYGCSPYEMLISAGKPVFHIEYANYNVRWNSVELKSWYPKWVNIPSAQLPSLFCLRVNSTISDGDYENIKPEIGRQVSTVIKTLDLTQFAVYCDGTWTSD